MDDNLRVLARQMHVNVLIKLFHGRVALLCARLASEQLCGISLVTRQPIAFPPCYVVGECAF